MGDVNESGGLAAGPRHGWVWTALPSDCATVRVEGDESLGALLGDCGIEVASSPGRRPLGGWPAVVFAGPLPGRTELDAAVSGLATGGIVSAFVPRPARALAGISQRRSLDARRIARIMVSLGLSVERFAVVGERSGVHRLQRTDGSRRPTAAVVLIGRSDPKTSSVLTAALDVGARELGARPLPGTLSVRGSGALLLAMRSSEAAYMARLLCGPAERLHRRAEAAVSELSRADEAVSRLVLRPVLDRRLAVGRISLEPKADGRPPRDVDPRLLAECTEFLAALRSHPARSASSWDAVEADLRVLSRHVDALGRDRLDRLGDRLRPVLEQVSAGWGHGDFWNQNLLVERGRPVAVLDWDSANDRIAPLYDLLHLRAHATRSLRRLSHGERCVNHFWPLLAGGGDAQIRGYCRDTGTPAERPTLEALGLAYWLGRVARDLRLFADRSTRDVWMSRNLERPLAALPDL